MTEEIRAIKAETHRSAQSYHHLCDALPDPRAAERGPAWTVSDRWHEAVMNLIGSIGIDDTCGNTGDADSPSRMVTGNVDDDVLRDLGFPISEPPEPPSGQCLTCGTQCSDEGICPVCAELEYAEQALAVAQDSAARRRLHKAMDAPLDSCRKCGAPVTRGELDQDACVDDGHGPEQGKVFVYCSATCKEAH